MKWWSLCFFWTIAVGACTSQGGTRGSEDAGWTAGDVGSGADDRSAVDRIEDLTLPDPLVQADPKTPDPADWMTQDMQPAEGLGGEDPALDPTADPGTIGVPCTVGGSECSEAENCIPAGDGQSLVCGLAGATPPGGRCKVHEDCIAGSACVAYSDDFGFCKPLCSEGHGCSEPYQVCIPWFGIAGAVAGACLGTDCMPPDHGCPDGERCTVLANLVLECVPAGSVPVGGDCTQDECASGAICLDLDGDTRCRAFCSDASGCAGADDHCVFPWKFKTIGFCRPGCDPVLQQGCPAGEGCYFSDPEIGSTLCWAAGDLEAGADCSDITRFCKPGSDCILQPSSDPFEYYCRAYCDGGHPCAPGFTCEFPPASPAMGVCLPD